MSLKAQQCIANYGNADKFAATLNPDIQIVCVQNERNTYMGYAPTLNTMSEAYGAKRARLWIEIELNDLAEYTGAKQWSEVQRQKCAETILGTFGYMKATELMLFLWKMKSGEYGQFYGSIDGMKITANLQEFAKERRARIAHYESEDAERRRNEEMKNAITYEEWKQKQLQ